MPDDVESILEEPISGKHKTEINETEKIWFLRTPRSLHLG